MPLFDDWCDCNEQESGPKRLLRLTEKPGGRNVIADTFPDLVRSHYDNLERIADDIRDLGYPAAAAIMAERLPRSARARSGELGEIIATEFVEEKLGFTVPVRRLRYKDGREMALRGDDFIGARIGEGDDLFLLKGEAKSRAVLGAATIAEARAALTKDNGRPTAISLLFVADRLIDAGGESEQLGKKIRTEIAARVVPPERIGHALFTFSGNGVPQALLDDFAAADADRYQAVANLHIGDHQAFIAASYEKALELGDG